jgi:hypothetical protein
MERQVISVIWLYTGLWRCQNRSLQVYYGVYPKYSYFMGCSRGGGQAMMEAQRYPDDFRRNSCSCSGFNWAAIAAEFVQNIQAHFLKSRQNIFLHLSISGYCRMLF